MQGQASPRPGSAAGGRHTHMQAGCCWGCPSLGRTRMVWTEPPPVRTEQGRFGWNLGQFHPNSTPGDSTCWADEGGGNHSSHPLAKVSGKLAAGAKGAWQHVVAGAGQPQAWLGCRRAAHPHACRLLLGMPQFGPNRPTFGQNWRNFGPNWKAALARGSAAESGRAASPSGIFNICITPCASRARCPCANAMFARQTPHPSHALAPCPN